MSSGPPPADGPRVRQLDEGLGLAVLRVGSSPRTLVTYARDHVTVRTPSRPDFRDGNTLDLDRPPEPSDLPGWVDRVADTIGRMGVRHVQLRWETPLAADAPAAAPAPDPALVEAAERRGFVVHPTSVLLLDELAEVAPVDAELAVVTPPSVVPGGAGPGVEVDAASTPVPVERRWHAVHVLGRYATGDDPDDWRAGDADFDAWALDVLRELTAAGRATTWTAQRHGAPVARAVVVHDRQGLAAVEDVVVHPVHRGGGIASALTRRAVATHLEEHPVSRVGLGAEPGSTADRLYRRLGFRPHATVWTALRPG